MKHQPAFFLFLLSLVSGLTLAGCGGGDQGTEELTATSTPVAVPVASIPAATTPSPAVTPPPTGTAPAAMTPAPADPFESIKVSRDGSPNKTDMEALQAVVDAYAFGPDGTGAPPLNTLDELVAKGYLKRLPPAPKGMKWAYDSAKWKVSVVPE